MRKFRSPAIAVVALALLLAIPSAALAIDSRAASVVFTDANTGYMSGGYVVSGWPQFGFVSKTVDGGKTWTASRFDKWVSGFAIQSPADMWAISSYSNYGWHGASASTWTLTQPIGHEYTPANAQDVVAVGSNAAVAVGKQPGLEEGDPASIWRTTDKGATWQEVWRGPDYYATTPSDTVPPSVMANLTSVDMAGDNKTIFAVGTEYRYLNTQDMSFIEPKADLIMKSDDAGVTWSRISSATANTALTNIDVVDSSVAWIVKGTALSRTVNGQTFSSVPAPGFAIYGIAARSASVAVVVGAGGRVAYTDNAGASWHSYTTTSRLSLSSVAFRDSTHVIAVGDNQNIIRLTVASDGSLTSPQLTSAVYGFYPAPAEKLSMSVPSVSSYASAKITGRIKIGTKTVYNKPVKIEYSSNNVSWRTLATAYTNHKDSGGYYYTYTAKPTAKTYYRASYASKSYGTVMAVLPKVYLTTPSVSTTTMRYGSTYTVSGTLKPKRASGSLPVKIQAYRYESGRWVLKKTYSAKASDYSTYSKYAYSMKLPYKGSWRIRAYFPADWYNASTYTGYRSLTVK